MEDRLHVVFEAAAVAALLACASAAYANVGAAEAAALGKSLTPVGAERAGNAGGTIPAWTGGEGQRGSPAGEFPHDPTVDGDRPLFTITHDNYATYAGQLMEGSKELLKRYSDYRMIVYPTRRTASFPEFIYKATAANALSCTLAGTDKPDGCTLGFPFPIPRSGAEPIWNHKLKWRGDTLVRFNNQFIVQPNGEFQQTKIVEKLRFEYANDKDPHRLESGRGELFRYLSQVVSPPRLAGTFILVQERAGTGDEGRNAWLYSPGIKRVRRAPTVQYDNFYEGTDGNEYYDQVDMFNGALDRYAWKLVGKKEMYIPYNSNRIGGNTIKYTDMIRPRHLNQDLPRYELHRVWIVEAQLAPGTSHTFKTRRFYLDEDSWDIVGVDNYDNKNVLYKFQEGHLVNAPNAQLASTVPEVIYDFFSGRYFITAAFNEDKPVNFTPGWTDDDFTVGAIERMVTK